MALWAQRLKKTQGYLLPLGFLFLLERIIPSGAAVKVGVESKDAGNPRCLARPASFDCATLRSGCFGQREREHASLADLTFDLNRAMLCLKQFFRNRETQPRAAATPRHIAAIESLKDVRQ